VATINSGMLYGSKGCPVCCESLLFGKDKLTGGVFFFCRLCGCAWSAPPAKGVVDSLTPIKVFAPTGIALPTRREIEAAGLADLIEEETAYSTLPEYLIEFLRGELPD
jgi:hypothetical protein